MVYILTAATILISVLWIYLLVQIKNETRKESLAMRGILKHYNYGHVNNSIRNLIKKWLISAIFLFIVFFIWVIVLFWKTDLNFLIAVYPFLWHYFVFRYFLWEKEDIMENPGKSR
ncbi:MAG: hypothetical protein OEV66_10870 [Spirochaetia bacterium]|nr:hypothetical protein [Spirochaetia bacterium]